MGKEIKKKKMIGGCTGKGFDVLGQPSPEVKKKGWERKKAARRIMNLMQELGDMTYKDFKKLAKDIERYPGKHTLQEVMMLKYMSKDKFITDYLDRNIGKAPQAIELSTGKENSNGIKVTIVDPQGKFGIKESKNTEVEN